MQPLRPDPCFPSFEPLSDRNRVIDASNLRRYRPGPVSTHTPRSQVRLGTFHAACWMLALIAFVELVAVGVALALLFEVNITLAVFAVSATVSLALLLLQRRAALSGDTLLGLLAHSARAIGLVVLAFMTWVRFDLMGFLFGDILAVSKTDIAVIWIGGAVVLVVLTVIWKPLFAGTVNRELAAAEGMAYDQANIAFMLLMAAVVAISMKIVGVLLITAMLLIPAATARRFAGGPEQMAILAAVMYRLPSYRSREGEFIAPTSSANALFYTHMCPFSRVG